MKRTVGLLSFLLVVFLALPAAAQSVTGTVTDSTTGDPFVGATVFIANTTLSTTTDATGMFELDSPPQFMFEVVAVADGKIPAAYTVDRTNSSGLTFPLSPAPDAEGSAPSEDDLDFFETTAFSQTRFASDIELVNPDVLRIERDEANNVISVWSVAPFEFINPALGYHIRIHDFQLGGNQVGFGWGGYAHFIPIVAEKAKEEKQWSKNRETTYEGSRRHFLKSVIDGRLKDEEWAAYFVGGPGAMEDHSPIKESDLKGIYGEPQPILYEDERPNTRKLDWAGWIWVEYFGDGGDARWPRFIERHWPVSALSEVLAMQNQTYIQLPDYTAFVDASGVMLPSTTPATQELGFWTFFRMADMLPQDWQP